jgi:lipoprotein-anchoring transpeptidase ErfK/SrfK
MRKSSRILMVMVGPALLIGSSALAQIGMPTQALPPIAELVPPVPEDPLVLRASVSERMLYVQRGDTLLKTFLVAVGTQKYPTPRGRFTITKIIWNPSWRPPPNSDWAKDKLPQGPGDPDNPMKVVKIFFKEPYYYIHGTDAVESLGSAASHGCIRMDPAEVAELARLIMEHGGQPRDENWFWRIIHSRRQERVVYLNNPVSITVEG